MSAPNAALAYRVLDQIDAHPEAWDQQDWLAKGGGRCGTSGCFAGWAVVLAGLKVTWGDEDFDGYTPYADVIDSNGEPRSVAGAARDVLGTEETGDLFSASNTREDLGRLVAEIFGPRPDGGEGGSVTGGAS